MAETMGSYKGFAQFENTDYSIRAGIKVLRSYNRRGIKTIRQIIETFAPATENDTERYVNLSANGRATTKRRNFLAPL